MNSPLIVSGPRAATLLGASVDTQLFELDFTPIGRRRLTLAATGTPPDAQCRRAEQREGTQNLRIRTTTALRHMQL